MDLDEYGKPVDLSYLEIGLPLYLQKDLEAYLLGCANKSTFLDCLYCELAGDINCAENDGTISSEQASYLRNKYLSGVYEKC